jgi:hypothetical protein
VAWFISRKALAGLLVLEEGEKLTRPKLVEKKQQLFFSDSSYETERACGREEKRKRCELRRRQRRSSACSFRSLDSRGRHASRQAGGGEEVD